MNEKEQERIAAQTAKALAMMCVRNTFLEDIHAGRVPVSRTGDYSDVKVIDADGREIPWPDVSRISDEEMRRLMKQVVNRLYTWFVKTDDLAFHSRLRLWIQSTGQWDQPELDEVFLRMTQEDR